MNGYPLTMRPAAKVDAGLALDASPAGSGVKR